MALFLASNWAYSQEVHVRIKNDSKYFINEVTLKEDSSRVYFQNIQPNEFSDTKTISKLRDTNWIIVQFVKRKFFTRQLITISINPIDHSGENLYEKGCFTLRINVSGDSGINQAIEKGNNCL